MMASNSRIPKVPEPGRFKRPNENKPPFPEKKPRMESTVTSSRAPTGLRRAQSTMALNNIGGFSEKAKKVALMPPQNGTSSVRGSMPVKTNQIARESISTRASQVSMALRNTNNVPKKPKRAAWDLKGRIQDMEEHMARSQAVNKDLRSDLEVYNQRIAILEQANNQLHKDVEVKSVQSEEASSMINCLEKKLRDKEEEYRSALEKKDTEIKELRAEIESLQQLMNKLKNELESSQLEASMFRQTVNNLTASQSCLQAQLEATKALLQQEQQHSKFLQETNENLKSEIEEQCRVNCVQESKLREGESVRRKLHNTIQELKGNIRVFCRVRPIPLDSSRTDPNGVHIVCKDHENNNAIEIPPDSDFSLNESNKSKNGKCQEFTFDYVFDGSSSQAVVFDEISQLVQSVLDGYNVCIFAYGPTGSGKTYTMEGPESVSDFVISSEDPLLGMIPRSVQQIFTTTQDLVSRGWKYKIEVSCLEIYNETIRDLLTGNNSPSVKCEIKMSGPKAQDSYVSNMTTVEVFSAKEVYALLKKAKINRSVAVTLCNERSSRSHYVFQMKLSGENSFTTESCEGILNLVDLAGSERIKQSGSSGERLKEAKNINKSLSNLGNVIMALSQKADHIPYRNSKLTHLLMNSLGGNSKTLMFVNVNPSEEHLNETLNSLRFAAKVNQCNIGTAQKRIK